MITLRMFEPEKDYPMVREWMEGHRRDIIPQGILPKLGVIVHAGETDVAALWLYMDNSVGVCFLEYPVTKPGTSLRLTKKALLMAADFLKKEACALGYSVMFAHTLAPIARILRKNGWSQDTENQWIKMAIQTGGA